MANTTLNRRRNQSEGLQEEEDVYDLDNITPQVNSSTSLSVSAFIAQIFVQLSVLWLALWAPFGRKLLDDPVVRLQTAILILGIVRIAQCALTAKCGGYAGCYTAKGRRAGNTANSSTSRYQAWITTVGLTLAGTVLLHIMAILFGAQLVGQFSQTWHGALFISLMAVTPVAIVLGNQWSDWLRIFGEHRPEYALERSIYYPLVLTIVGAWIGGIVLPLDWDRPWQAWPIPSVVGATGGYTAGLLISLLIMMISP
ncbi:GPI biosynthesis protein family Pig-F-domain-containing protein [Syncephalis fuscata]|nr:GPI biosynthesis protein family Pig-F-domain-containing protein [Syncephalis fuscata]